MTKPKIKIKIKDSKRRGEWAEMRFMAKAAENGLEVTKPFGETAQYDFVVEHGGKFARVQVKSTLLRCGWQGYQCTVRAGRGPYARNAFDYIAVYVILEDTWYIVPAKAIGGKWAVKLYPNQPNSKYEPYREAWHLLRGESLKSGRVRSIEACTEEWTISPFSVSGSHDEESHVLLGGI